MRRRIGAIAAMAALLVGCASPGERVHIRVRNDGPWPWQAMWLGAGGPNGHLHGFGAVDVGETTAYASLPAVLADYRKTDVLVRRGLRVENIVRPVEDGV